MRTARVVTIVSGVVSFAMWCVLALTVGVLAGNPWCVRYGVMLVEWLR